jgi:uncharacterized protein YoxC
MSTDQTFIRIGFLLIAVAMIVCAIANAYAANKRDKSLARLQVRIDALEARLNIIARKPGL